MRHTIHVSHATTRQFCRTMVALAVLLAAVQGPWPPPAQAANSGFVQAVGGEFVLNGAPFRFVGTNAYYLHHTAASGSYVQTDETMSVMSGLGMKVLRIWAFGDGTSYGTPLQPSPGVYTNFEALDYVVAKANEYGMRLILVLVNHWDAFGGMPQYVQWCDPGKPVEVFYTNATCKQIYQNYVSYVVNRYKNDPTIFAWELANEPRTTSGADMSGQTIRNWVAEMAAHIKSIDPDHMVGTGEEGYDTVPALYSSVSQYNNQTYLFNGWTGVSFSLNTAVAYIDYGSIHLYPEFWNFPASSGPTWIADHAQIAQDLGKPLLLGEFGSSTNAGPIYDSWLATAEAQKVGGSLVWQLMCPSCAPWADQFGVVYPPASPVSDTLAYYVARANGVPPPVFTIGQTTATPTSLNKGQKVLIHTAVTSDAAATGMVVTIEIRNGAGTGVAQKIYSAQTFAAREPHSYDWTWRAAGANVAAGTYTVKVSVSSSSGSTVFASQDPATTFIVR